MWEEQSTQYWKERDPVAKKNKYLGIGAGVLLVICGLVGYFAFRSAPVPNVDMDEATIRNLQMNSKDPEYVKQLQVVASQKSLTNCNAHCFVVGDTLCDTVCKEYEWTTPR